MTSGAAPISSPIELYRRGVAALREELGPVDTVRFLHLIDQGSGDYTAERQAQTDDVSLDQLCEEIRAVADKE